MQNIPDYFKEIKLKYIKNGLGFSTIALTILSIINIINQDEDTIIFILALLLIVGIYLYIKRTNNIIIPGYILISAGYALVISGFLNGYRYENILEIFWMINLTIVAYYILGKAAGIAYLLVNSITVIVLKIMVMEGVIVHFNITDINAFNKTDFIVNMIICTGLLGYLFHLIITINDSAQQELYSTNILIKEQNEEKTVMLKEIHHRVKNNLQVITSLLRLKLYRIEDEDVMEIFQDSISRISTMSLIHSKMYQGDTINYLDLKTYLDELIRDLVRTYATKQEVKFTISSEIQSFELNNLVPFSLIINELVTNSIKHGFENKAHGNISIQIKKIKDLVIFDYIDDGNWKKPNEENSFGMELIATLSEQLFGYFTLETSKKTHFHFELKLFETT